MLTNYNASEIFSIVRESIGLPSKHGNRNQQSLLLSLIAQLKTPIQKFSLPNSNYNQQLADFMYLTKLGGRQLKKALYGVIRAEHMV